MTLWLLIIAILALLGTSVLTTISTGLRYMRKYRSQSHLNSLTRTFFYRPFHQRVFKKKDIQTLYFSTLCARHITLFCYAAACIALLGLESYLKVSIQTNNTFTFKNHLPLLVDILFFIALLCFSLVIADLLPRAWVARHPESALRFCAPIASIFLFLLFPFTVCFSYLFELICKGSSDDSLQGLSAHYTDKLFEILKEAQQNGQMTQSDRALISSVLTFKDRIVREVMIPRIDMFSLPANTTIEQASQLLLQEGYSRVPIYSETVDHIVGILMYKDVLATYMANKSKLQEPIESLVKPVFYTPESKKVSHLLQEFKSKKSHIAIVVDEYGGTEGLVTIEDILEEIVGEIADEYDEQEELLFTPQPGGGWIVDARMNIIDAEENFNIIIPQDGDYDTIGGYVFYRAGAIPPKGFRIHHDTFDLEVISSNDRIVKKVKIYPRTIGSENQEPFTD